MSKPNSSDAPLKPEPLDAEFDDVLDAFPDGETVETPPSEADAPVPPG